MQFSPFIGYPILAGFNLTESEIIGYWGVFSFLIGTIVILILVAPTLKEDSMLRSKGSDRVVMWSILGVFMAYFAQIIAANIEIYILGITTSSENTQTLMNIARDVPLFVVVTVLFAPVLEEIVFRKILFGSIYKKTNFWIAGIISSLIFSVVHGDISHTLTYTAMGFVFAFLYVKTKRIIVPIFAHMMMNGFVVLVQYNLTPEDLERMEQQLEQMKTIFIGG